LFSQNLIECLIDEREGVADGQEFTRGVENLGIVSPRIKK
jgi:hypothetical protein